MLPLFTPPALDPSCPQRGVRVSRVPPEDLPLVDGRCSAHGWCLVEEGKDCKPSTWAWPATPCEQLNMSAAQRDLYAQRFKPRHEIAAHIVKGVSMNDA
jgi:hypothetical protein